MINIDYLLKAAIERKASDLHLSAGLPPIVRVDGDIQHLSNGELTVDEVAELITATMNDEQKKEYEKDLEIDYAYKIEGVGRFRVNAFTQQRGKSASFRAVPEKAFTLDELNCPPVFKEIAKNKNGIVLVTGPTGSGKSTTLASIIDYINHNRNQHIITIEDPIEFLYKSDKCLINQREVGSSTKSFPRALKSALREDPDIILVGEMRDIESIRLALEAAETGHLVLSTLHTNSAIKTVDRIINVFPEGEQNLIRSILSLSLRAVIAQTLIKKIGGGRVASYEIMLGTPAIANLIRENKISQMTSALQTGQAKGMCTMQQYIDKLLLQKLIDPENVPMIS